MALADSVPGVSGGTVAFIMGIYDKFIGSIHDLTFGDMKEKKEAARYLLKLGIGWGIGMAMAVVLLFALFENHIYVVSSLFFGSADGLCPESVWAEYQGDIVVHRPDAGGIFCGQRGLLRISFGWDRDTQRCSLPGRTDGKGVPGDVPGRHGGDDA